MLRDRIAKLFGGGMQASTPGTGAKAPEFRLPALDGKQYSLSEALGRGPTLLAFFKESCPICQFTLPFIERIFQRLNHAGGVQIWGISQDDERDSRDFAKEYKLSFPILLDQSGYPVSNAYGLTMVPTLFLIEPDGKITLASLGFDRKEIETIAARLGECADKKITPFLAGENIPDYKPG